MDSEVLRILVQEIDDTYNRMAQDLARGVPKDFAEYKFASGSCRGLLLAKDIMQTVLERLEKADD